jgi:hypothetical protein
MGASVVAGSVELELGTYAGMLPGGCIRTTTTMAATAADKTVITTPRTDACRLSQRLAFPRMGAKINGGSWRLAV